MDKMLTRKINLLLYLAKVDGKFADSEKQLMLEILRSKGLEESYLEEHKSDAISMEGLHSISEKEELLYWILKMIKADGLLHADEIAFAKAAALKLGYRPDVVDSFGKSEMPHLAEFNVILKQFIVSSGAGARENGRVSKRTYHS